MAVLETREGGAGEPAAGDRESREEGAPADGGGASDSGGGPGQG